MPPSTATSFFVIGTMSGTSLDGLDMAYCRFNFDGTSWTYKILAANTRPYPSEWAQKLTSAHGASAQALTRLHFDYGKYTGLLVKDFISQQQIEKVDFVSSHGHTIFHQPDMGFTFQLGHGAAIAAACGVPVYADFRSLDVALGGQGAPLVPIGDKLLFNEYDACINLGGIANISYEWRGERVACDICPCNLVLNAAAHKKGLPYDDGGAMAACGKVNDDLLTKLNSIEYYQQQGPKSMGREWIESFVNSLVEKAALSPEDLSATFCSHIVTQIGAVLKSTELASKEKKILLTGGGAYNSFLVNTIIKSVQSNIEIPNKHTIEFKEALIFAFLGVLRNRNEPNALRSVTGASRDSSGGTYFN